MIYPCESMPTAGKTNLFLQWNAMGDSVFLPDEVTNMKTYFCDGVYKMDNQNIAKLHNARVTKWEILRDIYLLHWKDSTSNDALMIIELNAIIKSLFLFFFQKSSCLMMFNKMMFEKVVHDANLFFKNSQVKAFLCLLFLPKQKKTFISS